MVVALATTAQAALFAADGYENGPGEYTTGSSFAGQSSASAVGFSGNWNSSSANLQPDGTSLSNGAVFYDDTSNGKGKFIAAPGQFSDFFRRADRALAPVPAPAGNTFYMSHFINAGSSAGPNDNYAFVGFGSFVAQDTIEGVANNLLGAFVGFVDSASEPSGVDMVLRYRQGAAAGAIADELLVSNAENNTYHVVMALEFNNPGDEIRYWVNPTDLTSEAGMDGSSLINGTLPGFQLSAASDMNRLSVMTRGFDRSFFWDESRLGDSLVDVTGIPEPTSLMLLGFGVVGALTRRRR
jgi:hypothetical protein